MPKNFKTWKDLAPANIFMKIIIVVSEMANVLREQVVIRKYISSFLYIGNNIHLICRSKENYQKNKKKIKDHFFMQAEMMKIKPC